MAVPLSPYAFYESARGFAQSALRAHHDQEYRTVTLDAGTALEHLIKASLANRSRALLSALKGEANFRSLLRLLDIPEGRLVGQLRTVGLRDALARVKYFVPSSSASENDLQTLIDMRDGTVHAALDDEVEERLLVAFVQYADALLVDLGRDRSEFWGRTFLPVVDALLTDASDKVAHDVAVKLAGARANFRRRYGKEPAEVLDLVRRLSEPQVDEGWQVPAQLRADCPACHSLGVATGYYDVEWASHEEEGRAAHLTGVVWFLPASFECEVCGLRLRSAELAAAGMETRWEIEGADPLLYEPPVDPDESYDVYGDRD
jgi:hypothetical protein